ncbi:ribonuclease H-like domain-containing protein [Tanacetum coccineum]|uniref:Ribonuclease H-like domain-containing protein n=1 Tax=Tanacetum coccineum TaxID=301880 RepID=A0ABQ5AMC8_9ASTR
MAFTCSLAQYVAHKTNVAQQFTPQKHYRLPHPGQGILGPAPAIYASQHTTLPSAFSIMPPQDPTWHMDTGASSHLNFNASNLSTIFDKRLFPSVHVGDGKSIPVTNTGHSIIPSHHRPLHLHNVLVTPNIIKNLISVRQFTRDNNCTIEFDAFGFSVKDYLTRHILLRCDSSGDLYPVTKPSTLPIAFLSTSASTWHQRLGHPGDQHKFHANGTSSRYKARLVANGSSQQLGVDFDETFSLVVKPATIRTVLSLDVSCKWPIHQLDVKNAFLNGDLSETVYMHQPPGFIDARFPNHFDMTDLGALNYFLGISAVRHTIGGLQYLTFTRPDLSYAVQQICLYMHDPREPHLAALKRILRYVQGTLDLGHHLYASFTTSLVGYTDADWAGCSSTRRSTLGYYVFLDDNLLSWSAKRQHTLSHSSAKAEYRGVANVVAETA